MYERLTTLQEGLIPKKKAATDDDLHRINELIQVRSHGLSAQKNCSSLNYKISCCG